jgi:dTDP-4-amino-4,6-dideoxygalactose transaminase
MLSLQHRRQRTIEIIERFYREHYLPNTVLVPSSRFGLYAVAKEVVRPGDSVLISPVTCHTVIQALLAADVKPVFVNIELQTGNIDISKLSPEILQSAKGIISTNLYGNPDAADELRELATKHGLFFLEDCAHVLRTALNGKLIGTFGDASSFSFKKYFGELGGILTLRDAELAARVRDRVAREVFQPAPKEELVRFAHYQVMQSPLAPLAEGALAFYKELRRSQTVETPAAEESAGDECHDGIDTLHKTFPTTVALSKVAHSLSRFEEMVAERKRLAAVLIQKCSLPLRKSQRTDDVCYLSVPFFSPNRDEVIETLNAQGIPCYFTYRIPMNRWLTDPAASRNLHAETVNHWCQQILPIDTRNSSQFLAVLAAEPVHLEAL